MAHKRDTLDHSIDSDDAVMRTGHQAAVTWAGVSVVDYNGYCSRKSENVSVTTYRKAVRILHIHIILRHIYTSLIQELQSIPRELQLHGQFAMLRDLHGRRSSRSRTPRRGVVDTTDSI